MVNGKQYSTKITVEAYLSGNCAEDALIKDILLSYTYNKIVTAQVNVSSEVTVKNSSKLTSSSLSKNADVIKIYFTDLFSFIPEKRFHVVFLDDNRNVITDDYYDADSKFKLVAPTAEQTKSIVPVDNSQWHYEFLGWKQRGSESDEISDLSSFIVSEDLTFDPVIKQTLQKYSVMFFDGDKKICDDQIVEYGNKAEKPLDPTRDAYKFIAWNNGINGSAYNFESTVKSDLNLYASWEKIHTVVFADDEGSILSKQSVLDGDMPEVPTPDMPESDKVKYYYSTDKDVVAAAADVTYTLSLDSTLKENILIVNGTGFKAGQRIRLESTSECIDVEGTFYPESGSSTAGVFNKELFDSDYLRKTYNMAAYSLQLEMHPDYTSEKCKNDIYIKSLDYYKKSFFIKLITENTPSGYMMETTPERYAGKDISSNGSYLFNPGNYEYIDITFNDKKGNLIEVQSVIKEHMPMPPKTGKINKDYIYIYKLPESVVPATEAVTYTLVEEDSILRDYSYTININGLSIGEKIQWENPSDCISFDTWLVATDVGSINDIANYTIEKDNEYVFGLGNINVDWTSDKCKDNIYIKSMLYHSAEYVEINFKYGDKIRNAGYINAVSRQAFSNSPWIFNTHIQYTISFYTKDGKLVETQEVPEDRYPELPTGTNDDRHHFTYILEGELVIANKDTSYTVLVDTSYTNANILIEVEDWKAGDRVELKSPSECVTLDNVTLFPRSSSSNVYGQELSENWSYNLSFDVTIDLESENCQNDDYIKAIKSLNEPFYVTINAPRRGMYNESPRWIAGTTLQQPIIILPNFNYYFETGDYEKYVVRILDADENVIETLSVKNGAYPRLPKMEETDEYLYLYDVAEELVEVHKDMDYHVTENTKRIRRDIDTYIKISNVGAGRVIKLESPSECIELNQQLFIIDEDENYEKTSSSEPLAENTSYALYIYGETVTNDKKCDSDELIQAKKYFAEEGTFGNVFLTDGNENILAGEHYGFQFWFSDGYVFTTGETLYNISFIGIDGKQIGEDQILRPNETPSVPKIILPKNDAQNTYGFHWDAEIVPATEDVTYTAVLDKTVNKYTISVLVNDATMGKVNGAGTYEYGSEVTLEATALKGYEFSNWEDDVKAAATRKVKVTADASYKAEFKKTVESSSSVVVASSSSGKLASSSSAKVSSSSSKPASSSSAKVSSSSGKPTSSSTGKESIVSATKVPMFSVSVLGRQVQIAGAKTGSKVAVFDMQGSLISITNTDAANFSIEVPRAGSYMVRIGNQATRVIVK